jgi:hypothetical protein
MQCSSIRCWRRQLSRNLTLLRMDGDHKLIAVLPGDPVWRNRRCCTPDPADRALLEEFFTTGAYYCGAVPRRRALAEARL